MKIIASFDSNSSCFKGVTQFGSSRQPIPFNHQGFTQEEREIAIDWSRTISRIKRWLLKRDLLREAESKKRELKQQRIIQRSKLLQVFKKTLFVSALGVSATIFPCSIARSTKPISKVMNECTSFKETKGIKNVCCYIIGKTGEPIYNGCVKLKNKISGIKKAHLLGVEGKNKKAIENNKELKELFELQ